MNKKGYTLVEILVVIALIAGLGIVSIIGMNKVISGTKEDKYNAMVEELENASNTYITLYPEAEIYLYTNGTYTLYINELQEALLIDENFKNPKTNTRVCGDVVISYDSANSSIDYTVNIVDCLK